MLSTDTQELFSALVANKSITFSMGYMSMKPTRAMKVESWYGRQQKWDLLKFWKSSVWDQKLKNRFGINLAIVLNKGEASECIFGFPFFYPVQKFFTKNPTLKKIWYLTKGDENGNIYSSLAKKLDEVNRC